jgi:hypothetical protein
VGGWSLTDRPKKNASFFSTPVKEGIVIPNTNNDVQSYFGCNQAELAAALKAAEASK